MFESMTYESILQDMLNRVTGDIDKREGSVIFDALAPCAYKLAENYFMLNNFIDLVSGDTAVDEYLDRVVADYGITRKKATKAIRKIETTSDIPIGSRWGIQGTVYTVKELLATNTYSCECEQVGIIGNQYSGTLDNIDNVEGVTATLTNIIISGTDTENDDNLRDRFYIHIRRPSTSGNINNYIKWALEVAGVGDVKVFPLWNGNGTVKVLIVDSDKQIDETLEVTVFDYIETRRPIGAEVTVDSPSIKPMDVGVNVILDGTRAINEVRDLFVSALAQYFKDSVFETYTISYAKIGSILLSTAGVKDYTDLRVNNQTGNITLLNDEIPMLDNVELTEV